MQKHRNFKSFKKNGCKNYELLGQVFSKSTATGHLHHASTQLPPTSDDERQNEEEFLNKGVHVIESEKSSTDNSKKRTNDDFPLGYVRVKKESKLEKLDACLEKWTSSLNAGIERDLAKAEIYKSQSNQASSAVLDPYSIEACMDILETMDSISKYVYNKALEKFMNQDWRKIFILIGANKRQDWLESLD